MVKASHSKNKEIAAISKAFALYQIAVDTRKAAIGGYNAMVNIPVVGPALAVAAAAAAIAFGAEQAAAVTSAQPKMAEGGMIPATSGGRSVTISEAGRDEAIVPLDDPSTVRRIQNAVGGAGDMTVVINVDGQKLAQALVNSYNKGRDINAVTRITTR